MERSDRRLFVWWASLVALTLLSFESSSGFRWLDNPSAAVALVIGVALLKVRIVIIKFMEVGEAPWRLRGPLEAWVLAIGTGILSLWYLARA